VTNSIGNAIPISRSGYYKQPKDTSMYEVDLEPYASLFLKPLTSKKCAFSKQDLEVMCQNPLHSPRLILYLINFFKQM